jgi:hypothetical protein
MDIRIWWNDKMVHSITYPLQEFHVYFSSLNVSTFQLFLTISRRRSTSPLEALTLHPRSL